VLRQRLRGPRQKNETGFGCKCELLVPDLGPTGTYGAMLEIGSLRVPAPLRKSVADDEHNRSAAFIFHKKSAVI
jgi:hypothetical protein